MLNCLVDVLEERNPQFLRDTLRHIGIHRNDLRPTSATPISIDQLEAAQRYARTRYPESTLRLYERIQLIDAGLMGYAIASSGSIRRALEITIRFHHITSNRYDLQLLETATQAIVRQNPLTDQSEDRVDLAEEQLGIVKILQFKLNNQLDQQLIEIHFDYPAPDHKNTYTATFPGPCCFDAKKSEVRFPRSWLDLPTATANGSAAAISNAICERTLGPEPDGASTAELTKRALISRDKHEIPSLEQAAAVLSLSAGQLRRRLYREGTSYKHIVLEVRMTLARHYLQATSLNVQEIAYLLGYSQAPPFSRAFKSYYGYPPSEDQAMHGEDQPSFSKGIR